MMKVVFCSYPRFGLDMGGLQVQLLRTAGELSKLGVTVAFHDVWADLDRHADILHCFSIDESNLYLAQRAKKYGLKVVLSPVLNAFAIPRRVLQIKAAASKLPAIYQGYKAARALFDVADVIIALNSEENLLLQQCFHVDPQKIRVIPNGVDTRFFNATPHKFQAAHPNLTPMVLQVASVEPRKNQLNVAKAVKFLTDRSEPQFNYVNIGPIRDGSEGYAAEIRSLNLARVQLMPPIRNEDPLLPSAYAAADIFILPSLSEVMPLVLYEAAAAGCRLLVSDRLPVDPCLMDRVSKFHPRSIDSIGHAILAALNSRRQPQDHSNGLMTWQQVAAEIAHACYGAPV